MGDSQELTIENFNSENTNLGSNTFQENTELKNIKINALKDISVPSGSSKRSYYEQITDSIVKYKEPTPREYNIQPEIMLTPEKLNARMTKVFVHNPLEIWMPTQFISSPNSIHTPSDQSIQLTQENECHNIYLHDLKEQENNLNNESLWDLLDLQGKLLYFWM